LAVAVGDLRPTLPASLGLICSVAEIFVQHSCSSARPFPLQYLLGSLCKGQKCRSIKRITLLRIRLVDIKNMWRYTSTPSCLTVMVFSPTHGASV